MREYLNKLVEWQRVVQRTGYGEPITENRPIMVRYEERLKRIVTSTGADAVSTAVFYCLEPVSVGDRIRVGNIVREILTVREGSFLDGKIIVREAFL